MKQKWVALPGGGGFCIIQALLLSQVDLSDITGFMGTSGGSINSAYLACELPPAELPELYIHFAEEAFKVPFLYRFNALICDHDDNGLNNSLHAIFGERTVRDVNRFKLIIPSIDFLNNRPKVVDNIVDRDDMSLLLWQVVRDSCGAPTFFPIRDISIDGGLWANDPSRAGTDTLKKTKYCAMGELQLLTVGSGYFARTKYAQETLRSWSKWKHNWIKPLANSLTLMNEHATEFSMAAEGLPYYRKYNPVLLQPGWEMNNAKIVKELYAALSSDHALIDEFKRVWDEFMAA